MAGQYQVLCANDVNKLVDIFYDTLKAHDFLSIVFEAPLRNDWEGCCERMIKLWRTVLLYGGTFYNSPFVLHTMPVIHNTEFDGWLQLLDHIIEGHFYSEKKDAAKWAAHKLTQTFIYKIQYHRYNTTTII